MTTIYTLDERGIFIGARAVDPHASLPRCTLTAPPELVGAQVAQWDGAQWVVLAEYPQPPAPPPPTQFELDEARYRKRAAVKDQLIAYMAADNMSRVRAGVWTVPELTGLMADPALAAANAYMSTLSYELAAQALASAETPLLTPAIRADWIGKLQAHFYLVP